MAKRWEIENTSDFILQSDLQRRSVVKSLLEEGSYPFILIHDGEKIIDPAICLIPANESRPPQIFEMSIKDARKLALLRNELQEQLQLEH